MELVFQFSFYFFNSRHGTFIVIRNKIIKFIFGNSNRNIHCTGSILSQNIIFVLHISKPIVGLSLSARSIPSVAAM